jgi:hypothetical protein
MTQGVDWNQVAALASVISAVFTAFAAVAAALAAKAAFATVRKQGDLHRSQVEHESLQSNVSLLVGIWNRLSAKPTLLRFHGVTDKELKAAGVEADELAYLIGSFEAAGYYYEYIDQGSGPFPPESLRYRMCASEATQRAWPLLKSFFAGSPRYSSRIEETIKLTSTIAGQPQGRSPSPAGPPSAT